MSANIEGDQMNQEQQKHDDDERQRWLLEILARVGRGLTTRDDELELAVILGLSDFYKEDK